MVVSRRTNIWPPVMVNLKMFQNAIRFTNPHFNNYFKFIEENDLLRRR